MRHTRDGSSNGVSTGDADPGTRIVVRFCERLRHLPLGVWADASERVERADSLARAARGRLRQTVERMPWAKGHVTPRVNELVSVAEGFVAPGTTARMKKVAVTAALALVARPDLSDEDFKWLYAPFADTIPLDSLERDGGFPLDTQAQRA